MPVRQFNIQPVNNSYEKIYYEMEGEEIVYKQPTKSGFLRLYVQKAEIHMNKLNEEFGTDPVSCLIIKEQ